MSLSRKYNKRNISTRRRRVNPISIYLLAGVVLLAVFVVLSLTVLFRLGNYSIDAAGVYSDEEIIEATGLSGGENLIRLDMKEVEKRLLSKLPYLETVKVGRRLPSTLTVSCTAAEKYAYIESKGSVCIVNKYGRALDITPNGEASLVILSGVAFPEKSFAENAENGVRTYASFDDERSREALTTLADSLDEYGIKGVTRIDLPSYLDITFVIDERIRIELGTMVDMDYKLKYVKGLIDSDNIPADEYAILNVSNVDRGASLRSGASNGITFDDVINFG